MREGDLSFRQILQTVGRALATVLQCWRRWSEEAVHERRRGSGRPRTTTPQEDRRLRVLALRDRHVTTRAIENEWVEDVQRRISMASV